MIFQGLNFFFPKGLVTTSNTKSFALLPQTPATMLVTKDTNATITTSPCTCCHQKKTRKYLICRSFFNLKMDDDNTAILNTTQIPNPICVQHSCTTTSKNKTTCSQSEQLNANCKVWYKTFQLHRTKTILLNYIAQKQFFQASEYGTKQGSQRY